MHREFEVSIRQVNLKYLLDQVTENEMLKDPICTGVKLPKEWQKK